MRTQLHRLVHRGARALLLLALAGHALAQSGSFVQVDPTRAGGSDGVGGIERNGPAPQPSTPAGPNGKGGTLPAPTVGSAAPVQPPTADTIARPETRDLGHALPGADGSPRLALVPTGDGLALRVDDARPEALALVVLGLDARPTPFRGGMLVPTPDLLVSVPRTNAEGVLELPLPALPDDLSFCAQVWLRDPSGPAGATASNALLVIADG